MELDIKSSTADKLIDIGNDFLQKFAGPSAIEQGLIWGDNMKLRRLENQIKNFKKVKEIVDRENISIRQVNLKILFPYLEGVSLEEDEELQDLWANLFVNYIDADKNLLISVYPFILSQISTDEVKILLDLEKNGLNKPITNFEDLPKKKAEAPVKQEWIANLERLGVIEPVIMTGIGGLGNANMGIYYLTNFGNEFLKACKR